jgi:outer membrane protein TolC
MNKVLSFPLKLVVTIFCVGHVPATQAQPTSNETLSAVIEQALLQHPNAAIANVDRNAAAARANSARAAQRPRLDLTVSNDVNKLYDEFTGTTATVVVNGQPVSVDVTRSSPRSVLLARLRLSYPLYTGGRLTAARNAAVANLAIADSQISQAEAQIARSVTNAWFALHRVNLQISNARAKLSLHKRRAKLLAVRVKRGRAARIELATTQGDVAALQTEIIQLQATRRARWADLSFARGANAVLAEPDWSGYTNAKQISDSIKQLQRFGDGRSLNRQLEEKVNAASQHVREAESAYKPNVSLFAQYNAAGRSTGTKWIPADQVRASDFTFGATIEWNLYAGGGTDARVAERAAELARRQLERDESIRSRIFAVESAEQERQAQRLKLDRLSQQLPLSNRKIELAHIRIKAGRADNRAVVTQLLEKHAISGQIRLAQLDLVAAHTQLLFANSLPRTP